jgi:hypothetical protein
VALGKIEPAEQSGPSGEIEPANYTAPAAA